MSDRCRTQKSLLVRIQDCHQRHRPAVQSLAQRLMPIRAVEISLARSERRILTRCESLDFGVQGNAP